MINVGVIKYFNRSVHDFPDCTALEIEQEKYSYKSLSQQVYKLANTLSNLNIQNQFVGLLAYRSLTIYTGVLSSLASKNTYLPFNPKFPENRIVDIINISKCTTLVVGKEFFKILPNILNQVTTKLTIIFPFDEYEGEDLNSKHNIIFNKIYIQANDVIFHEIEVDDNDSVYLLYTSGSTGVPKGIPILQRNICSYIEYISKKYPLNSKDRCSQSFDTTFDVSVHDMLITWAAGACLCCIPTHEVMIPSRFIIREKITCWFSVPAIPMFLQRLKLLKPNSFPLLRYSFFAGEALLNTITKIWHDAAPNSEIINLYGPTEVTITIAEYKWNALIDTEDHCINGIVPIGKIFNTHEIKIVDSELHEVINKRGELLISGPQVCDGYLNNPIKTDQNFIHLNNSDKIWYRTGDLIQINDDGILNYIGRLDHQIKIRGYRAELMEIEYVIKKYSNTQFCTVISVPPFIENAEYVVAFISDTIAIPINKILTRCKQILPEYMVPKEIYEISNFPTNINGKIDRKAITNYYIEHYYKK